MALTFGTIVRTKLSPGRWMTYTPVTFDSAYAVNGESYTANNLGLDYIDNIVGITTNGTAHVTSDTPTGAGKLLAWTSIAALTESAVNTGGAFVDVTTTGTYTFTNAIPAGMIPLGSKFACTAAFSGDTSAVWQAGVAGALTRYSADTGGSCFTAITTSSLATAATAGDGVASTQTPVFTVTTATDFTSVSSAAAATMTVTYMSATGGLIQHAVATDLSGLIAYVTAIGR